MYKRIIKLASMVALLALPAALTACGTSEASNATEVREAMDARTAAALQVFDQADPAPLSNFVLDAFAEDATMFPPNEDIIQGRQAIGEYLDALRQAGLKRIELTTLEVGGSGDTIYETGKYTLEVLPPGMDAITDSGKFLMVWKRQSDGSWKIKEDIFNTSLPALGP